MQGQFCSYMLQEYKEKEETTRRSKQVALTLPATMKTLGNGIPSVNIHSTHDGTIVTVREDGAVCFWSPELNPQKTKHVFVCIVNLPEYIKDKSAVTLYVSQPIKIPKPTMCIWMLFDIRTLSVAVTPEPTDSNWRHRSLTVVHKYIIKF